MPSAGEGAVSAAYAALAKAGRVASDPAQLAACRVLDGIAAGLEASRPRGFLDGLFGRAPEPLRGAYLVGEVGRGKTLLMDLFFSVAPTAQKRRVHFHEFMTEMHAAIAAFRASAKEAGDDTDPVAAVIKPLLRDVRLLCLDEFHVTDITNAMLLGRLFEKLFAAGVVLVATSNVEPDGLYRNGLNRQLFLPFIALLKRQCTVVSLNGPTDYRRLKLSGRDLYVFGTGPAAAAQIDSLFAHLTGGEPPRSEDLRSLGRTIRVPQAAMGVARFSFHDLCEKPLGAADYLQLGRRYDTIVVDGVPQFDRSRSNAAKRFILLIDTLYDAGAKFAGSFAAALEQLGADDVTAFEFQRTVSRLIEMRSDDYLCAPRKAVAPV